MNNSEKWNKICDIFEKYKFAQENEIQEKWEKIWSEIFGYSNLDIDTQRKLQLGSTERLIPDIIIRNQELDLFVVELKQEILPVRSNLNQLFSYLKQLKLDIGILIANKICIVEYDYNKSDLEQRRIEIEFNKDSSDGIKFIEFFSKKTFNKEKIKEFITKKNEIVQNVELIKKEISNVLVMELLKAHFVEKYSEKEFNEAIKGFEIHIGNKIIVTRTAEKTEYVLKHKNTGSAPSIEYFINNVEVSSGEFKKALLKVKRAKRTWFYSDKNPVEKEWNAKNFTVSSNLISNIQSSSEYRKWNRTNLTKVKCDIYI